MNITLKANAPIAHGAFTDGVDTGNIMEFRKIPIVKDGNIYDIPVISGNAVRGIIRRNLTREFFAINELQDKLTEKEYDKLYAIIGNGGALGKNVEASVDCNYQRELRHQLPILSLLGSACYAFMLNGMVNIGFFKIKCKELGTGDKSFHDLLAEVGETRHVDKNIINTENVDIKPMPYTTEVVIEGAEFEGKIEFAPMATEIEKSCLAHGIKLLKTVGGRLARGYGQVSVITDEELDDALYCEQLKNIDIDFIKEFIKRIS